MDKQRNAQSMRFDEGNQPSVSSFFDEYRQAFTISEDIQFKEYRVSSDKTGTHHRYDQYYKGIQIIGAQYILHEKNDAVWYANGELAHGLDMDVNPAISEQSALEAALNHIDADAYMWQDPKNESFLKQEQNDPNATFYPQGNLKLTSGKGDLSSKTMRLVYRFDIYAEQPLSRNWVDVDAKTGEIVNVTSRIHGGDFPEKNNPTKTTSKDSGNSVEVEGNDKTRDCTYCESYSLTSSDEWISNVTFNTINNSINLYSNYEDFTYISTDVYAGTSYLASVTCDQVGDYEEMIWLYFDWNADCDFDDAGESYDLGQTIGPGTLTTNITIPVDATPGPTRMRAILKYYENPISACEIEYEYGQTEDYTVNIIYLTGDVPGSGLSLYNGTVPMIVDAFSPGSFRLQGNTTRAAPIQTFNLQNGESYTNDDFTSVDANGPWDAVGVNAHWGAEATYDYFFNNFGRNSVDDLGLPLLSYVHYSSGYNNAFWDGSRMTYGDGDGVNYGPLVGLDVVGHELTHGVTEFTSNLFYQGESGALNESFSDIFGNLVEFQEEGAPGIGTGSWQIGEDFNLTGTGGFRNMEDPNEFNNPDTYQGFFWIPTNSTFDNGGVHINSGVQNFWFYLLSTGGTGTNDKGFDYNVMGIGLDNAGAIAYHNNTSFLTPSSNYYAARAGSLASAEALFGAGSQEVLSTADAWDAVGVYELPVPENDECFDAIAISCGTTVTGNTVKATFDADAPFCDTEHTTNGVWYTIEGTGAIISASMCSGQVYDSRLTVYQGSCDALVCVGADDDGCGGYANVSKYTWLSTEGTTYYILVHGFANATGTFSLTINGFNPDNVAINPEELTFDVPLNGTTSTNMTIANEGPECTKDLNWVIYKNDVANTNAITQSNAGITNTANVFFPYESSPELTFLKAYDGDEQHDHDMVQVPSDGQHVAPSGPPVLISGSDKHKPVENNGVLTSVTEPITLTQSLSQELHGITVACIYTGTGFTSTNGFIRDYNLPDFGVNSDLNVTEIELGIRKAVSASGSQPIVIYLATWQPDNTVTLIDSAVYQVPDQEFTMLSLPFAASVPANSRLLVQVVSRSNLADSNTFIVAANDGGQTAPSYLYGPGCSNDNYFWDLSTYWGFPNVHYVMNVKGNAEVSAPWLTVSGGAGSTSAGSSNNVMLDVDATDLELGSYSGRLRVNNNSGSGIKFVPVTMNVITPLHLELNVMLEGPYNYNNASMNSGLNDVLPLEQPYNVAPWNYGGAETINNPSPDYVDWVLLELRDATSAAEATTDKVIARQAALVKSDGQVVDVNGNPVLLINKALSNDLFVVIHHRNHLSIMSANPIMESDGMYSYDFTSGEGQALGGLMGQKNLGSGLWGMISGDGDRNGFIDLNDKSPVWVNEAGTNGYLFSDYNLDGESDNVDKNDVLLPNTGRGSQVPD